MPGANVNPLSASILCQFDIVRVIADHEGSRQAHAELPRRLEKKMGIRLDAATIVCATVRADVGGRDGQAGIRQTRDDMVVHPADIVGLDQALAHSRLIRYDKEQILRLEPSKRIERERKEFDLVRVPEVPTVLDQGTITVPEYSGLLATVVHECPRFATRCVLGDQIHARQKLFVVDNCAAFKAALDDVAA